MNHILIYIHLFLGFISSMNEIEDAESSYAAGEKAKTIFERKEKFNQALREFNQLEEKESPDRGNGKLYYDIANTYYQLGEYPLAVYYYERALSLNPRGENTRYNLSLALGKLGLPSKGEEESVFGKVFFFHTYFSLPERLSLFFVLSFMTIIFISLWVWFRWRPLQLLIAIAGLASLLLFGSVLYTRYLAPIEGIVIQGVALYRDAGEQYAKVTEKPLSPGLKVEVLDTRHQGDWLKVLTPDGTLGYVKGNSIRII